MNWRRRARIADYSRGYIYDPYIAISIRGHYDRYDMGRISMLVPDADLAAIDEVATPNRTAFMIAAAKDAVARLHQQRLDAEIVRCLAETASDDVALAEEFTGTAADGL